MVDLFQVSEFKLHKFISMEHSYCQSLLQNNETLQSNPDICIHKAVTICMHISRGMHILRDMHFLRDLRNIGWNFKNQLFLTGLWPQ